MAASVSWQSLFLLEKSSLCKDASSENARDGEGDASLVAGKQLLAKVEQLDCGNQLFKFIPMAGDLLLAELEAGSQLLRLFCLRWL